LTAAAATSSLAVARDQGRPTATPQLGGGGLELGLGRDKFLKLGWLTVFAVGMAYVESAVVTYLRFLYYPGGFFIGDASATPAMGTAAFRIELAREAATVVMLAAVAILAARRSWWDRLAYFIWTFAVWDIFYYVWLFVLLRWPPDLMTLDVLFLIPRVWVAPVILPVAVSAVMLVLATAILRRT
jgi:hypothetical protein